LRIFGPFWLLFSEQIQGIRAGDIKNPTREAPVKTAKKFLVTGPVTPERSGVGWEIA